MTDNIEWYDLTMENWHLISRGKYEWGQWISSEEVLCKSSLGAVDVGRITLKDGKFEFPSLASPSKFIPVSELIKLKNS